MLSFEFWFGRLSVLGRIEGEVKAMAIKLDALIAQVAEVTTVTGSAVTLITGIADELATLKASLADQPAVQAKIDELVEQLDNGADTLAAAVAANTPAADAPVA